MSEALESSSPLFELDREIVERTMASNSIGGICCSFAMDFAKKRLAGKTIDADTYKQDARIKKIARRQKLQKIGDKFLEGLQAVAKSYGLNMELQPVCRGVFNDDFLKFEGNKNETGLFYVSCTFSGGEGHGFAIDSREQTVWRADSDLGIFTENNSNLENAIDAHFRYSNSKFENGRVTYSCHRLNLR